EHTLAHYCNSDHTSNRRANSPVRGDPRSTTYEAVQHLGGRPVRPRITYSVPLREEAVLNRGEFHGLRAFLIVVSRGIDPSAHGITPHQSGIAGLQQFGRRTHILPPGSSHKS